MEKMLRITWERKELEDEILSDDFKVGETLDYLNLTFSILGENNEILFGSFTFARIFFSTLFSTFQYLDPAGLGDMEFYAAPDKGPAIVGFEMTFDLRKEDDILLIKHERYDYENSRFVNSMTEIPFKDFILMVLEAGENFIKQIIEIRPDLEKDPTISGRVLPNGSKIPGLKEELEIISGWYRDRYKGTI